MRIVSSPEIVHGSKKKAPIFVVELENNPGTQRDPLIAASCRFSLNLCDCVSEIVFRSYVASKAWKKALAHFSSLTADEFVSAVATSALPLGQEDIVDYLTPQTNEDGFGLLRRNISRVIEGLHQVLHCQEYQFWEQRHPIEPEVHAKLRARLKTQVKETLKADQSLSKQDIRQRLSQEFVLAEYSQDPAEFEKTQQMKQKQRREEEKRSVREAARKLLEEEMKAQEEAKEAQRKAKEDRKNAILEARMELVRQKEARKEALRLAREEEKRAKEEERELKRALREEEKKKKQEEKENSMKRRIEELRQRRKLREEQKSILENGVVTTDSTYDFETGSRKKMRTETVDDPIAAAEAQRQKNLALVNFVAEEKKRRRRIRFYDRKADLERLIWASVQNSFIRENGGIPITASGPTVTPSEDTKGLQFPAEILKPLSELDAIPSELQADVLYIWDFISTFADCLRLPVLPSLAVFVKLLVLGDESSPVGDGSFDEGSLGYLLASVHAAVIKLLMSEYFPILQMGTTLDEFYRTRPLNGFSWPELARLTCLLFIESNHPSSDEFLIKMLKGTKSNKDDSAVSPLRRRLQNRGEKLLQGLNYEETLDGAEAASIEESLAKENEAPRLSSTAGGYYGVVLDPGQSKNVEFEVRGGGHLAVKSVSFEGNAEGNSDEAHRELAPGDYLLSVNGCSTKDMELAELQTLLADAERPHGMLLSKTLPPAKGYAKHYATTTGSTKLKRCAHVLKILRGKELSVPFNQPVDADLYPDYYSSIPDAIDLGTIAEKLEDEDYENDDDVESFMDDVGLVWKNCYTYNSVKAEISLMARKLSVIFDRLMNEWVLTTATRPLIVAEEDYCRRCQTNQVKDRLLLCDRCDAPYHTFCLDPPLAQVPSGEWYCPTCIKDPAFSPDQFRKKAKSSDNAMDGDGNWLNENELTEFEKRVYGVSELLAKENYSELTLKERTNILRVLCDLVHGTAVVQSVYHTIEEKATKVRRDAGEPLADLEREWRNFSPPRTWHNIEHTRKFFIDGVEHDLTDELLDHLEARAKAELEGQPIPELSLSNRVDKNLDEAALLTDMDESSECSANSDEDDEAMLEEFGDRFLAEQGGAEVYLDVEPMCEICGLGDGILSGALVPCKRSVLTQHISQLDQYEVPQLLAEGDGSIFRVETVTAEDLARLYLQDSPNGVTLSENSEALDANVPRDNEPRTVLFAVNDRLVAGMPRQVIASLLKAATFPLTLYLTSLPCEVLGASVSIVKCRELELGVNLGEFGSRVFVQSYASPSPAHDFHIGLGELCEQVFPGDVLYMVNTTPTLGKSLDEVQDLLRLGQPNNEKYVVFVRPPHEKVRELNMRSRRILEDVRNQHSKITTLRAELAAGNNPRPYEVVFGAGPLGLVLGLDQGKVMVKSLSDQPGGVLSQASLSRQIRQGDVVERVNNLVYGPVRDLSQFTTWLLSLPRPLKITFTRGSGHSDGDTVSRPQLEELAQKQGYLRQALEIPGNSVVKTYRCMTLPLPFSLRQFVRVTSVVAVNGQVQCEEAGDGKGDGPLSVEVGDRLVGVNGRPIEGVLWPLLAELLSQLIAVNCPIYLHFVPHRSKSVLLTAHLSCVQAANMARAECEFVMPQIEKARQLESFLETAVPRSHSLGKCRSGLSFYRFFSDRQRLFVVSPDSKSWQFCQGNAQLTRLLMYLEDADGTVQDAVLARRIRRLFHDMLHGSTNSSARCCKLSAESFQRDGPFALQKQVVAGISPAEVEIFEAFVSYLGRRFTLGSFPTRQAAESALQLAENFARASGLYLAVAGDAVTLANSQFPGIGKPVLKAEAMVRRYFARKYDYTSLHDARGARAIPISHFVYQILKRGLHAASSMKLPDPSQPNHSAPQPYNDASNAPQNSDLLKRKLAGDAAASQMYAAQQAEQWKRLRTQDNLAPQQHLSSARNQASNASSGTNATSFKSNLQALVDRGRSMLAAWNQFSTAPGVQTANGLAYACLASFEEVKRAASRILVDPNGPLPDFKTFVCLHHAYVMGLICAMAAQALVTSRMSPADSAMVKSIADCFATAILNCMDPSVALRSRALSSFAVVANRCEPANRTPDLSQQLNHVSNFILQFLRATQYLANGNFEDMTQCRPITIHQGIAGAFPVSFIQQMALLHSIRGQFTRLLDRVNASSTAQTRAPPINTRVAAPAPVLSSPATIGMQQRNPSAPISGQLIQVAFEQGPLGIVINYSDRGTIIVTEFSNENGVMGQAQATGKVMIGDEVYAVNGKALAAIGMEGFKAAVGSGIRPLHVVFRRCEVPTPQPHMYPASGAMFVQSSVNPSISPSYNAQPAPATSGPMFSQQSAGMMVPPSSSSAASYAYPSNTSASITSSFTNMEPLPFNAKPDQPRATGIGEAPGFPSIPASAEMNPYMGSDLSSQYYQRPVAPGYGQEEVGMFGGGAQNQQQMGEWQNTSMPMAMPSGLPQQNLPGTGGLPNPGSFREIAPAGDTNSMIQNATGAPPYVNFVSPNDPRLSDTDPSQVNYYDANGTTFRGDDKFELDVNATSETNAREEDIERSMSRVDAMADENEDGGLPDLDSNSAEENFSMLDSASIVTEEDASAQDGGASRSVSQMTTPVQSDNEDDSQEDQTETLQAVSNVLQGTDAPIAVADDPMSSSDSIVSAPAAPSAHVETYQPTINTPDLAAMVKSAEARPQVNERVGGHGDITADSEDLSTDKEVSASNIGSRRSTRVSKKITSNIADLYDPNLSKLTDRNGNNVGSGEEVVEPTDGEVGELATELLEQFYDTIRPVKTDAARSLLLLRAQLLTLEAAIPREAFRAGKWSRSIRAGWAELVCASEASRPLLEAIVYLESCIEPDWLDPCWKASPIPTGRNAIANSTIASAAMRLYALDDAISYVRIKRSTKRKPFKPSSSAGSSRQSSPIKMHESPDLTPSTDGDADLSFLTSMSPVLREFASKRLQRIVDGQRDKTMTTYLYRKVSGEISAAMYCWP